MSPVSLLYLSCPPDGVLDSAPSTAPHSSPYITVTQPSTLEAVGVEGEITELSELSLTALTAEAQVSSLINENIWPEGFLESEEKIKVLIDLTPFFPSNGKLADLEFLGECLKSLVFVLLELFETLLECITGIGGNSLELSPHTLSLDLVWDNTLDCRPLLETEFDTDTLRSS